MGKIKSQSTPFHETLGIQGSEMGWTSKDQLSRGEAWEEG